MSVIEKLKEESTVKISGAMLMYIAHALRERQVAILKSIVQVEGDTEKEIQLVEASMANEVVGEKIMDCIGEILGKEDFEKFIDGTLDINLSNFAPTSSAIN